MIQSKRKKIFGLLLLLVMAYFIFNILYERYKRNSYDQDSGKSITYVLIDGLSSEIFHELIRHKELPFLQSLIEKSTYVENGVSSFPTMTGFAFYPFLTGEDAVNSGIYGLRWFDKDRSKGQLRNYVGRTNVQMNHDLRKDVKTLFELVDSSLYTCSINTYMNRGVKESVKTGYAHTTAKYEDKIWLSYLKNIPYLNKDLAPNHFQHEEAVTNIAIDQLSYNPKVQWITYPSPDASNHVEGTNKRYRNLLKYLDKQIERLYMHAQNLGQKQRAFVIISDHGVEDVYHNIDPCIYLKKNGLAIERGKATVLYSTDLKEDSTSLRNIDGHFVINGNLSAYIYLKDEQKKWKGKVYEDLLYQYPTKHGNKNIIDLLLKMEGIDMLAYCRKNGEVVVATGKGKSSISYKNNEYKYDSKDSIDVFDYKKYPQLLALVNNGFYHDSIWRNNSLSTDYPDAIHRVYQLMSKQKVGDILLLSKNNYDFGKDYESVVLNYKGGHGGLRKNMLLVPYILYFPEESAKYVKSMRSEEVGKMVLNYMEVN